MLIEIRFAIARTIPAKQTIKLQFIMVPKEFLKHFLGQNLL